MPSKSLVVSETDEVRADRIRTQPYIWPLLLLFVGSGCSALIYEIVWLQLLQLVIGASALSLGVLLGTFMGGMCLGSLLLPRLVSPRFHPLRVYAVLELALGILGVALLYGVPWVNRIYLSGFGHGMPNVMLRAVVSALCLLPPTILMGATLPAIARWLETSRDGVAKLGYFYGSNIAGAVFGCVLAGFYLLRVHDAVTATYVAASINIGIAVIGLALAGKLRYEGGRNPVEETGEARRGAGGRVAYLVVAMSGVCALGAEVVWTRQLSLLLGATVYTFSIILAVFLVGLGIGSSVGAAVSRKVRDPRLGLAACQFLVVLAVAWSAYQLSASLPYWPIDVSLPLQPWLVLQLDVVRCLWAILPAALFWGASFPLALAAGAVRGQDPGKLVGGMYAANTVGAIFGALVFSWLAIERLGTHQSQQWIMALAALSSLLAYGSHALAGNPATGRSRLRASLTRLALPLGGLALVVALILAVPKPPEGLIGYGRNLPTWAYDLPKFLYTAEGMNASVAVSEMEDGVRNFHVSGKVVASSDSRDMRLQRMLGHVPALLHAQPKSVLVVGCGAGVTAGSFLTHPSVERVVVCEIEPLIPRAATEHFGDQNYQLLEDSRVEVIYDDARHFVATTSERFDIITSDPIHPWVKGAAMLYSKEYFELCKSRLTEKGVVTQWVPMYETSLAAVQTELATFFEVFPHGTIWSNDNNGVGYDLVLLGQVDKPVIDPDQLQERLDRDDHMWVVDSLSEVNLGSSMALLMTYGGRAGDLRPWFRNAEINRDSNLRLQYLAGSGLNRYEADSIYDSIASFRRYPADMFRSDGIRGRALRVVLQRDAGR